MNSIPEQFSEARKSQLDAQFNFFRSYTDKAFDSVEKVIALNFEVSRDSLERSSALVRQMIAAKDPRELFTLSGQTQSQFDSLLAYSRRLFGIAVDAAAVAAGTAAKAAAVLPAPSIKAATPAAPAPAAAAPSEVRASSDEAPAHTVMPPPERVVVSKEAAQPGSIAEPNPVAKAVGHPDSLTKPIAASFPVPSSSKPIAVAPVKPVEAEPPHAPVSGTPDILTRTSAEAPAKPSRKK
jgi:phasin family protein